LKGKCELHTALARDVAKDSMEVKGGGGIGFRVLDTVQGLVGRTPCRDCVSERWSQERFAARARVGSDKDGRVVKRDFIFWWGFKCSGLECLLSLEFTVLGITFN